MATIITKNNISSSQLAIQMTEDLKTLFDFVKEEDNKLYITDTLYIIPGINVMIGNGNGITFYINIGSSSGNYYKLVKSATGDVAIIARAGELTDNFGFRLAIVKVKNAITNEESYGIFANSTAGGGSSYDRNLGRMMLFTDDVTNAVELTSAAVDPISLGSYTAFGYGAKSDAPIAVLGEAFSHQSQCITTDLKVMYITPHPYNGECLIAGKNYYCISYIAMLDE